ELRELRTRTGEAPGLQAAVEERDRSIAVLQRKLKAQETELTALRRASNRPARPGGAAPAAPAAPTAVRPAAGGGGEGEGAGGVRSPPGRSRPPAPGAPRAGAPDGVAAAFRRGDAGVHRGGPGVAGAQRRAPESRPCSRMGPGRGLGWTTMCRARRAGPA